MADIIFFNCNSLPENEDLEEPGDGMKKKFMDNLRSIEQWEQSSEMEDDSDKNDDNRCPSPNETETGDDDYHSQCEVIFKNSISKNVAERQMVGKLMINAFQNAVKNEELINPHYCFDKIEHIIYDSEGAVRSDFVECLPHLAVIVEESSQFFYGKSIISDRILQIVLMYLRDRDNQVRQDAQAALRVLLDEVLTPEQITEDVCNVIIELSCEPVSELQALALTLMTKVNPYIGDEVTEKLFLDRFLELCKCEAVFVRRVCASIMGDFFTIMSNETIYNKLLAVYSNLCLDDNWGVRKTSVDVMMSVARSLPRSLRRTLLSKLLVYHLQDESRWVRRSAYEILGPFISTFAKQFDEIICDKNGELMLVHEGDGWPRIHVLPVAKYSDIMQTTSVIGDCSFNFSNFSLDKSSFKQLRQQNSKNTTEEKDEKSKESKSNCENDQESSNNKNDTEESAQKDDAETFNTFRYYYDPPAMPLDDDLLKSMASENETSQKKDTSATENFTLSSIENEFLNGSPLDTVERMTQTVEARSAERGFAKRRCKKNMSSEQSEQENVVSDAQNDTQSPTAAKLNRFVQALKDAAQPVISKNETSEDTQDEVQLQDTCTAESENIDLFNDTIDVSNTSLVDTASNSESSRLSSRSSLLAINLEESEEDAKEIAPPILVEHFISMAKLHTSTNNVGPDMDYHCAYSFPAVVLTLGKENWHRLRNAYVLLATAVPWKVRSTLASSIHEIAEIIEEENAASDLVNVFNGFIKDLDEVRICALKHFSTFLKVLSPQDRLQYLPKLNEFLITDNKSNWRLKEELAKQLSKIIYLYERIDAAAYIAPLLLHLMQDKVAAVRRTALDALSSTIEHLDNEASLAVGMIQEMREVLMQQATERWVIRQTYALICWELFGIISEEVFVKELLPYLLELAQDRVPNVRLVVARTLARKVIPFSDSNTLGSTLMNELLQKVKDMQADSDRDVRLSACEFDQ